MSYDKLKRARELATQVTMELECIYDAISMIDGGFFSDNAEQLTTITNCLNELKELE